MSGHTPGPWLIHDESTTKKFIVNCETTIAQTMCGNDTANARLIASAPELLEALQEIVSDYEFCKAHPSFGDRGESYAETAREAIAKATGQQP